MIEARVGYQGVFQLGRPFPLEVELSNSGRAGEGTIEVQVWKGGATKGGTPYPVHYRRQVFLSAHSRKAVQFTVDPDFISRPLVVNFAGAPGKASREVDLRRNFSPAPVMLLVAETSAMPPVFLAPSAQSRLVALSLGDLPPEPRAWLGVSHLILYNQSLRDLSRAQLFALDTWLSGGGRLIVLGSLNYALYQEPALSRFLPVRVTGTRRINWAPALSGGDSEAPIVDVWVQVSTVKRGKVLADDQGVPLLVETSRGKGRIIYCALDIGRPPLAHWAGLPALVRRLLAPTTTDSPAPQARWDDSVFSQLILSPSFAAAYIPTGSLFALIVSYLGGIGVCAWLWQRRRRPPRIFLFGLTAFIMGAALGGYAIFRRGGNIPDGVLLVGTVMENSVDGYAEAQTNVALFSTQIRPYTLELEDGWIDLTPVSLPARERPEPAVVLQDGTSSRYQLALREWDYRLFRLRSIAPFAVHAEFEPQGDQLLIKIVNQSAKDLVDCWVLLPGQRHALGEIPRGVHRSEVFPLAPPRASEVSGGRAGAMDFRDLSFPDKVGEVLFHSSFFPRHGDPAQWNGNALFFGWVKDPERTVRVDDPRMRIHKYALFRATFPLNGAEDE
jgi:hypothetical protein